MVFVKSSRFKWVSATLVIPSERRIAMHHLDLSNALQPNAVKLSILTHLRDSSLSKLLIFCCQWFLFRKNPLKTMAIFRFLL